jgi:hypothetical protein
LASPDNVTQKSSLGLFDHFTPHEQDLEFRVTHFLSYGNGRAYRGRSND